ncbi:DUF664 domain-containing protein [Streptomyces sp. NPDC020403]|uniref:mycothiol transferase n=1 Tax=unclassified Streptomyces TaxID=2593676 RepID=UPI0033E5C9F1
MDDTSPCPKRPGSRRRTARCRLPVHLVEETARHAGHADVVRESLDGRTDFELVAEDAGYPERTC